MNKYLQYIIVLLWAANCCFAQNSAQRFMDAGEKAYAEGNFTAAISAFEKSISEAGRNNDNKILGKAYNNLGNCLSQTGKAEKALKCYHKALNILEKAADTTSIIRAYKNIGALYSEQKDFTAAMKFYGKAMAYAEKMDNKPIVADCLNNMGVVYEQQEDYKKALKCYTEALAIYTKANDKGRLAMTYNNLAIVYKYLKEYDTSIKYYGKAIELSRAVGDKFMVAACLNNLGNVYAITGDYDKSLLYCMQAYDDAKAIGADEIVVEATDGIATAYEKLGKYRLAIAYMRLYREQKDKFINVERAALLAEMQTKFETEKKESEIKLLKKDAQIKQLKLERRKRLIIGLIVLTIGLGMIGFFWQGRQKLKNRLISQKIKRDTEEQERLRIAKDIHDDLGSGLSKINFLSEIIVQQTASQPEVQRSSAAVQETAKRMVENMRDLIWALNPENTTLPGLAARMREYSSDFLEDYPVEVTYNFPDTIPQLQLSKECHRELFMVVKETLNNIVKHSGATKVDFTLSLTDATLEIRIKDNGSGFDAETVKRGNGLNNIKSRRFGECSVSSVPGQGTEVKILARLSDIENKHDD